MLSRFLADVLPAEGRFALWTRHNKQHLWAQSHEELLDLIAQRVDDTGVYYATAAFGDALSDKTGTYARTQANVLARRAFHLDLDAGEAKLAKHGDEAVYATQRDALADLVRMARETQLVPTYIVSSGEGLHAYYCLSEDVDEPTWRTVAKGLSRLVDQCGLKQDRACTTDSARILRPIGTLHDNGNRVSTLRATGKVYALGSLVKLLGGQLAPAAASVGTPRPRSGINDAVLTVEGPPKSIRPIVLKCGALQEVFKLRGNVSEPLWRAALGVAKHTVEGAKAAHALSCGHPDYDYADTQAKFDRWATGPATCEQFSLHSKACGACPHQGTIKSPISLGAMNAQQVQALPPEQQPAATKPPAPTGNAWDGQIPPGFEVRETASGHVLLWKMPVEKEDPASGETVTVYVDVPFTHDVFWFGPWADADHTDDTAQVIVIKYDGAVCKTYTLEQSLLANQQKMREELAAKSIITTTHKNANRAMEEYTKSQLARIRSLGMRPKITGRFGLRILPDGRMVCAQGKYTIFPDGEIHEAMLGSELRALAPQFELPLPKSDSGTWPASCWEEHLLPAARRHVDFLRTFYSKPGLEKYQLAAMLGLASPLMAFVTGEYISGTNLPANGLSVSLYSKEGGRGKTTLMRAIALAFGRPGATTRDSDEMGSTDKARIARLNLMGTMPVGLDEMGNLSPRSTSQLIYTIANGSSRDGAYQNGGLRLGNTWALIALLAANKSQRELLAMGTPESAAVQYRMLELDVDDVAEFDQDERARFTEAWASLAPCAGALGAVIHRAICHLGAEHVNKLVMRCVNRASEAVQADQTARFQYRGLGAVMALHSILQTVGLEMFDMDRITEVFREAHDAVKSFVTENILTTDGLELMSMMLHDMHEHTVVTASETRRARGTPVYDLPINGRIPPKVVARHIIDSRITYVSAEAVKQWCVQRSVSMSRLMMDCRNAGVMAKVYASKQEGACKLFNLLKGMKESSGAMISCYAIDVRALARAVGGSVVLPGSDNVVPIEDEPSMAAPPSEATA